LAQSTKEPSRTCEPSKFSNVPRRKLGGQVASVSSPEKEHTEMYTVAQREHYLRHKERYRRNTQQRRLERRAWLNAIKSGKTCKRCGESDPICLDFHHTDSANKDSEVSRLLTDLRSKERILKEIDKCEVLCSNCHRKLHRC
jgi:hypothetical protein